MVKRRIFLVTLVLFLLSIGFASAQPANFKVSSYLRTWNIPPENQKKGSVYWNAGMIVGGKYLTDIIIAFALIDPADGTTIYIPELRPLADGSPMFTNLWAEVTALKRKFPKLKVNFSVGGWGAEGFSDMANDPKKRATFAANVCTWLEEHDLDGVDIDWEYPVGPEWGQEIKSRPADRANWISLLRDLRAALDTLGAKTGKTYSLSTCVPASPWFLTVNDVAAAAKIVDRLKLMAYDYYGGWNQTTGHLANLYNNPDDPEWGGWSTDQALALYLAAGIPPEKIMLGLAFYGRAFQGVERGATNGLFQPYKSVPSDSFFDGGTTTAAQMKTLAKKGSGYTRYWDPVAKSPYLYNGDTWITYTDAEAIRLIVQYAKEKKLGGVFMWEYGHDIDATLLKELDKEVRKK